EKVTIPVTKNGLPLAKASGRVAVDASVPVRAQPVAAAAVIGELEKGAVVDRLGTYAEFTKVGLGADRFGFVETVRAKDVGAAAANPALKPSLTRSPPLLDVAPSVLATRGDKVHIEGVAIDGDRVLDAFIFVGSRKVFYQSNRKGADPRRLPFALDADLNPG